MPDTPMGMTAILQGRNQFREVGEHPRHTACMWLVQRGSCMLVSLVHPTTPALSLPEVGHVEEAA